MNYVTITGGGGHNSLTFHRGGPLADAAGGAGRVLETIQQEGASDDAAQVDGARANVKHRHPSNPTSSALNPPKLSPNLVRPSRD